MQIGHIVRFVSCPPKADNLKRIGQKMKNRRIVLKSGQIRKANAFLRNWAIRTESDNLAILPESCIIRAKGGKAVLRGIFF